MASDKDKKFRALSYIDWNGEKKSHAVVNCELIVLDGTHWHRGDPIRLSLLEDTVFEEENYLDDMLYDILDGDHDIDIQYSGGIDFDRGVIYSTNATRRREAQHGREQAEEDRRHKERRIKIYGPWPEDLAEAKSIHRALIYTDDKDADGNNTHVRVNCEMVFHRGVEYRRGLKIPFSELEGTSLWRHGMLDDILEGDGLGLTASAAIDFDTGDTFKTDGRKKWLAMRELDRKQDSGATPMELACKYVRAN